MPKALDLTGRKFGQLEVLRAVGRTTKYGGCTVWRCRCSCGAELDLPAKRLGYAEWIHRNNPGWIVTACATCRGHDCAVCGVRIPMAERQQKPTCSDACWHIRYCAQQRRYWRKRCAADPNLPRKMHAKAKAKAKADPEYAAKMKIWSKKRHERHRARMKSDPEYAARYRAWHNAHWERNAAEIQAKRDARLNAMTPDQLSAWMERARMYARRYAARHAAEIRAHPERHARYLEIMRAYRQRKLAAKAAADLNRIGATLESRRDTSPEGPK